MNIATTPPVPRGLAPSPTGATLEISGLTTAPAHYDYPVAARRLNCSERHLRRLVDAGRAPKPVRLGSLCRFNVEIFERWIAAGCPRVRTPNGGTS
jgi:excisionase family DNA binding protein